MADGIRFCTIHCSSACCSLPNIGKAVKMDSTTAKKGTIAVSVVKVRLLAVSDRWSSRKRWRSMASVSRHGKSSSSKGSRA